MFSHDKCINCGDCVSVCPAGIHYRAEENGEMKHFVDRNKDCIGCRKCEEICTQNALDIMGKDVTVSELMEIIMQDYDFYILRRRRHHRRRRDEPADRFCRRLISRMQKDDD